MENFTYQSGTQINFGKDQINTLHDLILPYGKKVLLAYGGGSIKRSGLYDKIRELLSDCTIYELSGIDPNPRIESVIEGRNICIDNDIDVIIAVGGGSVIDCAKVTAASVYHDGDIWEMVKNNIPTKNALPVITVLTIAATGSEYDASAVISNTATNEKLGYDQENIRPKASILDPTYTFTVPAKQTAAGTIDIISHLLEQYFAPANTLLTDSLLIGALKTAVHYAPIVYSQPDNYEARGQMMWLSSLACNGIFSTGSQYGGWSCHAIEHELSAFYDVTHGVGLAIVTPQWMHHVLNDSTKDRFARYGIEVFGIDPSQTTLNIAYQAIQKTEDLFRSLNVPMTLHELNIATEHFDEMAEAAAQNGMLAYAYVPLNAEDVKQILTNCL